MKRVPAWKTAAAYAAVYSAWGSTYFAIRVAVRHCSVTALTGTRFVLSGLMMGVAAFIFRRDRARAATARELVNAALVGLVMLGGGTGFLVWAEQTVPSGVAALVVGCAPILFAVFNRLAGGAPLTGRQAAGGLMGLAGVFLLSTGGASPAMVRLPPAGLLLLICGMVCWASASVASSHVRLPGDMVLTSAVEMLATGLLQWGLGLRLGDFRFADLATLPGESWAAIVYLAVVGSCVGFTAYTWLLRHEPPNRVSSYAFVNPVVAVILGVAFLGEPFSKTVAAAMALVVGGVSFSMTGMRSGPGPAEPS